MWCQGYDMILRAFRDFVELDMQRADASVLSGAIRTQRVEGKIKYFNALTNVAYDTFAEAKEVVDKYGITAAEGTGLPGTRSVFANVLIEDLDSVVKKMYKGQDVSVDLITMNLTGEKNRFLRELMRKSKMGAMLSEDETHTRALRIRVGDRFLQDKELNQVFRQAGILFDPKTNKFGKRAKGELAAKQIPLRADFGQYKMAVFDPRDLMNEGSKVFQQVAAAAKWDAQTFRMDMVNNVTEAYGNLPSAQAQTALTQALLGMDNRAAAISAIQSVGLEGLPVSDFEALVSRMGSTDKKVAKAAFEEVFDKLSGQSASRLERMLVEAKVRSGALKAFDGQGLISASVLQNEINRLQQIRNKTFGTDRKAVERIIKELEEGVRGRGKIFNLRASGMQIERLSEGVLRGEDLGSLYALAKGNYIVTSAERMRRVFGSGIDIVSVDQNISAGSTGAVGRSVAMARDATRHMTLTAEPNKPKTVAFFDIITPSTGSQVVSRRDLELGGKALEEVMDMLEDVAKGQPIDPDSRAFNIFKSSIEANLESSNLAARDEAEKIFRQLEKGKLPRNMVPVAIKRFTESLRRTHFDSSVARIPLPHTQRAYMVSSAWANLSGMLDKNVAKGEIEILEGGYAVFSNSDLEKYYDALGGADLDDAVNITYRDSNRTFEVFTYRQPNSTDEAAKFKINNIHRNQALRKMLRNNEIFKAEEEKLMNLSQNLYNIKTRGEFFAQARAALGHGGESDKLVDDLYEAWRQGHSGRNAATQILDEIGIQRAMGRAVNTLEKIDGNLIARGMTGSRFREMGRDGRIRFPGTERRVGNKKFVFSFRTLDEANTFESVLERVASNAQNSSILGKWVNSKATLGMWLDMNSEQLAGLTDPEQIERVLKFLNESQYLEEAIIDAATQGSGIGPKAAQEVRDKIAQNWEEQARLTLAIDGLVMDEYMVRERMPKGRLRDMLLANAEANLGSGDRMGLPTLAESIVNDLSERGEAFEEVAQKNLYQDIEVPDSARMHAQAILRELDDVGRDLGMGSELAKNYQFHVLQQRYYASFEGPDRRFGQQAVDLFVALSQQQKYAGLVRKLGMGVEVDEALSGAMPDITLDDRFAKRGFYILPTEGFGRQLSAAGLEQEFLTELFNEAEEVSGGFRLYRMGTNAFWFDRAGQLLPESQVDLGQDAQQALGKVLASENPEDLKLLSDTLSQRVVDEASDIRRRRAVQPLLDENAIRENTITAASGEMKRGLSGLVGEMWGHLGVRGKRISMAGAAVIAVSMITNARRDRDYREDQIGPPRDVPELYNQGLAMSGANYASLTGDFGTTYDIRTRGGNMPPEFLQTLAEITGGDVYADTYRDPLNDRTLEDVLRNYR